MKTVIVTGGFDPLHSGHIAYFEEARKLGDRLLVGLNSDDWLIRKKGYYTMPVRERASVVAALSSVHDAYEFNDDDDTACAFIKYVLDRWYGEQIIFANGGDRIAGNCPELTVADPMLTFAFNVGGEKVYSSSDAGRVQRSWGWWRVLAVGEEYKVKELCIEPQQSLSMQRHEHRQENWTILDGQCVLQVEDNSYDLGKFDTYGINTMEWHQATNPTADKDCHILEIQIGDICEEDDIERR